MTPFRSLATAVLLVLATCTALAGSVTGKWVGHVSLDESKMPKATSAQQQTMRDQMLKIIKATKFNLDIKSNKTWSLSMRAAIMDSKGKPVTQTHSADGTWRMVGSNVVLTTVHDDGGPGKGREPQTLQPANGGKVLKMLPPPSKRTPSFLTAIVFTRAGR